jgi:Ser/Thr protein kinase RdoA (MazF antagonist)
MRHTEPMTMPINEDLRAIASRFDLGGELAAIEPLGRGLINDTYLVTIASGTSRAVLQRINRRAFPQPEAVMQNMTAVLAHAARGPAGRDGRAVLRFPALYRTRTGGTHVVDEAGEVWRAMTFIDNTRILARLENSEQATEVGRAMGRFHAVIRDLDPRLLTDSRPDYHDTPRHLQKLDQALDGAETRLRDNAEVRRWLEFVDERRSGVDAVERPLRAGLIPRRPIHGDTKLDNFLFDADTIRPGIVHHDIADCLRSCCNVAGESPAAAQAVRYDMGLGRSILQGYFETAAAPKGDIEVDHLYQAVRLIPFELGMRFLTDYLGGNRYFKTEFTGQNLLRAATQFRLVADIERQRPQIEDVIAKLI